jgi:hypothetical protein
MKEQAHQKAVPLSQDELTTIGRFLPTGSTVLGGVHLSNRSSEAGTFHAEDCVIAIYALDDHTIHQCQVCGGGDHYEISGDTVVGSW